MKDKYKFHGGCTGCTNDMSICPECRYMLPDWSLPSLNPEDIKKQEERDKMISKAIELRTHKLLSEDGGDNFSLNNATNRFNNI